MTYNRYILLKRFLNFDLITGTAIAVKQTEASIAYEAPVSLPLNDVISLTLFSLANGLCSETQVKDLKKLLSLLTSGKELTVANSPWVENLEGIVDPENEEWEDDDDSSDLASAIRQAISRAFKIELATELVKSVLDGENSQEVDRALIDGGMSVSMDHAEFLQKNNISLLFIALGLIGFRTNDQFVASKLREINDLGLFETESKHTH